MAADAARTVRELALRGGKRHRPPLRACRCGCSRCRPAAHRRSSAAGTTGLRRPPETAPAGTGTPGPGRSTGRSRCACWTCRPTCGARPGWPRSCRRSSPAVSAGAPREPYDRRALRSAAAPQAGRRSARPRRGRGAGGDSSSRRHESSAAARRLAEAVLAGRPEAERQLEVAAAGGIEAVPRGRGRAHARFRLMATQTETIQVSGIRCERCVHRLAAALGGHEGLESASANLMGQVTLAWDDERTDREALLAKLASAGFREIRRLRRRSLTAALGSCHGQPVVARDAPHVELAASDSGGVPQRRPRGRSRRPSQSRPPYGQTRAARDGSVRTEPADVDHDTAVADVGHRSHPAVIARHDLVACHRSLLRLLAAGLPAIGRF